MVQIVMFIPYVRHKFTVNANVSVSVCVCVRSRVLPYCSIDSLEKVVTTCRTFRVRDRKGFLRILST